jgi:hypothetical protein
MDIVSGKYNLQYQLTITPNSVFLIFFYQQECMYMYLETQNIHLQPHPWDILCIFGTSYTII